MEECIFCKIVNGKVAVKKIYEDDKILSFYDISPAVDVHAVIIPKQHIISANHIDVSNTSIVSHIFLKIPGIARQLRVAESGYRIINNCGIDAGQTVFHIHFHLLGGRNLGTLLPS